MWTGVRVRIRSASRRHVLSLVLLVAVGLAVHLHTLGDPPIRMWDESIYAQLSKQMVTSGDWLIPKRPRRNEWTLKLWFEKPPLALWLQAASMSVLGISEFAVRLPSALAGVTTALVAYQIARVKWSWHAGIAAGLLLIVYRPVLVYHHSAQTADTDMLLTCFGTLFVWWTWRARENPRWLVPAAVAAALAVLTKSVAAGIFLVVLAPLVAYHWHEYVSEWTVRSVLIGFGLMIPWPLYAYLQAPDRFVYQFITQQVINRASGDVVNYENTLFGFMNYPYFQKLIPYLAPDFAWPFPVFGLALVAGSILLLVRMRLHPTMREREAFILWWLASIPLGWSVLGGTYLHYLLPMVVPAVVITGTLVGPVGNRLHEAATARATAAPVDVAYILAGVFAVLVVVSAVPLPGYYDEQELGQRAVGEAFDETPVSATVFLQTPVFEWTNTLLFYIDRDIKGAPNSQIQHDDSIRYAIINESNLATTSREHTVLENTTGTDLVAVRFDDSG